MFYRIKENRLYDYADYKYSEECLEINISMKDYAPYKYIVKNGKLVENPKAEEEKTKIEKLEKKQELNSKIFELKQDMQIEEIKGNLLSVEIYKDVIKGLIQTREAL